MVDYYINYGVDSVEDCFLQLRRSMNTGFVVCPLPWFCEEQIDQGFFCFLFILSQGLEHRRVFPLVVHLWVVTGHI